MGPRTREGRPWRMKLISKDPMYTSSHTKVLAHPKKSRITLPALRGQATTSRTSSPPIDQPSAQHVIIMAKKQEAGTLDATAESETAFCEADGVSADDKKTHTDAATRRGRSRRSSPRSRRSKTFLASIKASAKATPSPGEVRASHREPHRRAIDDARTSRTAPRPSATPSRSRSRRARCSTR